jgi:hypothetical protein
MDAAIADILGDQAAVDFRVLWASCLLSWSISWAEHPRHADNLRQAGVHRGKEKQQCTIRYRLHLSLNKKPSQRTSAGRMSKRSPKAWSACGRSCNSGALNFIRKG